MLVTVGQKGKYVGVVGLFQRPEAEAPLSAGDARTAATTAPPSRCAKLIEDEFQQMLKTRARRRELPPPRLRRRPPGATFVGAETCKSCHPNTFAKWATTKHAARLRGHRPRPEGRAERPPVRRRVRQLPHDGLRVHLGLAVGREDALPQGQPVRELPRPRLASTSPTPTTPNSARRSPGPRPTPTRTGSASAATTRTTRPSSTSPPTGARSPTRASTPTTTRRSTRDRPRRWRVRASETSTRTEPSPSKPSGLPRRGASSALRKGVPR